MMMMVVVVMHIASAPGPTIKILAFNSKPTHRPFSTAFYSTNI